MPAPKLVDDHVRFRCDDPAHAYAAVSLDAARLSPGRHETVVGPGNPTRVPTVFGDRSVVELPG